MVPYDAFNASRLAVYLQHCPLIGTREFEFNPVLQVLFSIRGLKRGKYRVNNDLCASSWKLNDTSFKDFSNLQSKKLPCTHCTLSWESIGYRLSLNEN